LNPYIHINTGLSFGEVTDELILSVDEYFKSQNINPIFHTADFVDGSFPIKMCDNCYKINLHTELCKNNIYKKGVNCNIWQGELKGTPIYQEMKCWSVFLLGEDEVFIGYGEWDGQIDTHIKCKYFSNETNTKNYYNELVKENKKNTIEIEIPEGYEIVDMMYGSKSMGKWVKIKEKQ